jgi:hypothetical protein
MDQKYAQVSASTLAALLNNLRRFKYFWDQRRLRVTMTNWRTKVLWENLKESRCKAFERAAVHLMKQPKRLALHRWRVVASGRDPDPADIVVVDPPYKFEVNFSLRTEPERLKGLGLVLVDNDRAGYCETALHAFMQYNDGKLGPAEASGKLQSGDVVTHIEGEPCAALPYIQVLHRIRTFSTYGGLNIRFMRRPEKQPTPSGPTGRISPQEGNQRSATPPPPQTVDAEQAICERVVGIGSPVLTASTLNGFATASTLNGTDERLPQQHDQQQRTVKEAAIPPAAGTAAAVAAVAGAGQGYVGGGCMIMEARVQRELSEIIAASPCGAVRHPMDFRSPEHHFEARDDLPPTEEEEQEQEQAREEEEGERESDMETPPPMSDDGGEQRGGQDSQPEEQEPQRGGQDTQPDEHARMREVAMRMASLRYGGSEAETERENPGGTEHLGEFLLLNC